MVPRVRPWLAVLLLLALPIFVPLSASASTAIDLNTADGGTVCPSLITSLNGFGTWDPTTFVCKLSTVNGVSFYLVPSGSTLTVEKGVTLVFAGPEGVASGLGGLTNYGTINILTSFVDYDTLSNHGTINFASSSGFVTIHTSTTPGTFDNYATFNLYGRGTFGGDLDNGGFIYNYGKLNTYNGTIDNFEQGLNFNSTIVNVGVIYSRGNIVNDHTVVNNGVIYGIGQLINNGKVLEACDGTVSNMAVLNLSLSIRPCSPPIFAKPSGSTFSTTTPTISGRAEPNAVVNLTIGGVTVGQTTVNVFGWWSITTAPLPLGTDMIVAQAFGFDGSSTESSISVIIT